MRTHTLTECYYKIVEGRWPFVLTNKLVVDLCLGLRGKHVFLERGVEIGRLNGDILTIHAGYASDGASPYFGNLCGLRIGTPSHRKTAPGFFTHDFLYQFGRLTCCPWTYAQADDALYNLMRWEGSVLAAPYHAAVSILGGLHRRITASPSLTIACLVNHKPS
jgi:hypothetical protein